MIDFLTLASIATTNTPPVVTESHINFTVVLSVVTICIAAFGMVINIWGNKKEKLTDENIRELPLVKELMEREKVFEKKYEEMKDSFSFIKTDFEKLKVESANNAKSLDELRKDSREMVQRMDDLLKQIFEFFSQIDRIG